MAYFPSVGDVLMLSQVAWKIGCAFTAGRQGAPSQFQEVENELNSLTYALTQLAESLDEDDSIISRADQKTKDGVEKILKSCEQTLENLTSFVNQYQELKKPDAEAGGRVPSQKSWKRVLLRNYKTIWWTAEGGNIEALRSMLNVHVNSILLMMQALQSKSISRLENTIEPMANKVDDIHTTLNGDLNVKIDEIHHLMLSMAAMETTPKLGPEPSDTFSRTPSRPLRPLSNINTLSTYSTDKMSKSYESQDSAIDTPSSSRDLRPNRESWATRPDSWISPTIDTREHDDTLPQYERYRSPRSARNSIVSPGGASPNVTRTDSDSRASVIVLPPPIIQAGSPIEPTMGGLSVKKDPDLLSISSELCLALQLKKATTDGEQSAFERALFSDSAMLCEARCTQVEYTVPDEENLPELKMIQGSTECRIFLVTKRYKLSSGILRFTTSIWALSDDRTIRLQQELPDGVEVIPYTVWGNLKKICIRVPTELRFYDTVYDAKPIDSAKTSWVNYVLEDELLSSSFQSALMGKSLIMTVQTNKTMRVHDGLIADTFSYAEQMCALENLRIWQDHETNGVMAMIHYSAHFRNGYLAFYLNSSRDPIRVRDDGSKSVKIKGLQLEVSAKAARVRTNSMDTRKSPSMKPKDAKTAQIKGAKIEFTTVEDKVQFLNLIRDVQGQFFAG